MSRADANSIKKVFEDEYKKSPEDFVRAVKRASDECMVTGGSSFYNKYSEYSAALETLTLTN